MPEPWRPGLPPVGTVCDVSAESSIARNVRVDLNPAPDEGYTHRLLGGTYCVDGEAGFTRDAVPMIVRPHECAWRPIEVPAGL